MTNRVILEAQKSTYNNYPLSRRYDMTCVVDSQWKMSSTLYSSLSADLHVWDRDSAATHGREDCKSANSTRAHLLCSCIRLVMTAVHFNYVRTFIHHEGSTQHSDDLTKTKSSATAERARI